MELIKLFEEIFNKELSYTEHQEKSDIIDTFLGFRTYELETNITEKAKQIYPKGNRKSWGKSLFQAEAWIGLSPKQLQTTYFEIIELLEKLDIEDEMSVCDLGAGYGRIGIVMGELYKKCSFVGFEVVDFRVEEGNRIFKSRDYNNAKLRCENLANTDFVLPDADIFFIYDYGDVVQIKKTLNDLSDLADRKPFTLVARGRGINSLVRNFHPWLCIKAIEVTETYSIYRS
jgi:hypothetical protein